MDGRPNRLLDDVHVVVVVHPVKVQLEGDVQDGGRADDDANESGRPFVEFALDVRVLDNLCDILGQDNDTWESSLVPRPIQNGSIYVFLPSPRMMRVRRFSLSLKCVPEKLRVLEIVA